MTPASLHGRNVEMNAQYPAVMTLTVACLPIFKTVDIPFTLKESVFALPIRPPCKHGATTNRSEFRDEEDRLFEGTGRVYTGIGYVHNA